MRISTHHISYPEDPHGEWTVELPWFLHKPLNILQRWKPTTERYVLLTNFLHAITAEWLRIRRELDQNK